jgi:hypothetical protein
MKLDFGNMIKANPNCFRALSIDWASMSYLTLRMRIRVANRGSSELIQFPTILCTNAVEYSIRPPNPATIEGGPLVELHE